MSRLAEKIRKLRQTEVEIPHKDYKFIVSRPTDIDVQEIRMAGGLPVVKLVERYVTGWVNVREMDIIPGGDPHPIEFDKAACVEWLSDDGHTLQILVQKMMDSYAAWREQRETSEKN